MIRARSWIGLCGRYSLLGSISRDIAGKFFPVLFEHELQLFRIRQVSRTASQKVVRVQSQELARSIQKTIELLEASTQEQTVARANAINPTTSPGSPGTIGRCAHLLAYLPYLPAVARPRSTMIKTGDKFSTSTYLLRRSPASCSSAVEGGRRALLLITDRQRGVHQQLPLINRLSDRIENESAVRQKNVLSL